MSEEVEWWSIGVLNSETPALHYAITPSPSSHAHLEKN